MPTKMKCDKIYLFDVKTNEKIVDINVDNNTLISLESESITDYAKDKHGNKLVGFTYLKSKTATLEFDQDINSDDFQMFISDDSSDELDIQISIKVQNRKHKKNRINKKWAKRYGYHYKYIDFGKWNITSSDENKIALSKRVNQNKILLSYRYMNLLYN